MATHRLPIMGFATIPDDGPFFAPIKTQLALANVDGGEEALVLDCDPASDLGCRGSFSVPKNFVGSPVLVIRGIIDGAVGTEDIHTGMTLLGRADNEPYDTAHEAEDIASFQSNAYADEDVFEETITLTVTLAVDDDVNFHFFIDSSPATPFTGNILVTGLFIQYSDA